MLQGALLLLPLALINYGLAPSLWASVVALFVVGAVYIGVLSGLNTVVQLRAPTEARGRVLSIYMMGLGVVYPIGAVVQGAIANHLGLRAVTVGGAVILLVVVVAVRAALPGMMASLGDQPPGAVAQPYPVPEELP